jgi:hypothetical protein
MMSSAVPENERSSGHVSKAIFVLVLSALLPSFAIWFKRLNNAAPAPTTARPTDKGFLFVLFLRVFVFE